MGTGFMAFGLTMILRPGSVRANFDRFADYWKQGRELASPQDATLGIALQLALAAPGRTAPELAGNDNQHWNPRHQFTRFISQKTAQACSLWSDVASEVHKEPEAISMCSQNSWSCFSSRGKSLLQDHAVQSYLPSFHRRLFSIFNEIARMNCLLYLVNSASRSTSVVPSKTEEINTTPIAVIGCS